MKRYSIDTTYGTEYEDSEGPIMRADEVIAELKSISDAVTELSELIDFGDFSPKWLVEKLTEIKGPATL